jgi:hypothetical protein
LTSRRPHVIDDYIRASDMEIWSMPAQSPNFGLLALAMALRIAAALRPLLAQAQ